MTVWLLQWPEENGWVSSLGYMETAHLDMVDVWREGNRAGKGQSSAWDQTLVE